MKNCIVGGGKGGTAEGCHGNCKFKRRQIRELQEDLQTMSNTMENLNRNESAYTEMIEEKEVKMDS